MFYACGKILCLEISHGDKKVFRCKERVRTFDYYSAGGAFEPGSCITSHLIA